MSRGRRPVVVAHDIAEALRLLVAEHAGRPCPTNSAMARTLDVNQHTVRRAVRLLKAARVLQIQRTAWIGGLRRRMRVRVDDRWSAWTKLTSRRVFTLTLTADVLLTGGAHHLARVLAAGRYDGLVATLTQRAAFAVAPHRAMEDVMAKSSATSDRIKGAANETVGKLKRKLGKMLDDPELKTKGNLQEAKGDALKARGRVKEKLEKRGVR